MLCLSTLRKNEKFISPENIDFNLFQKRKRFFQEDIGAPIKYNNFVVGVLIHIDENGGPAVITRYKQAPSSQRNKEWLFDEQIDELSEALIYSMNG